MTASAHVLLVKPGDVLVVSQVDNPAAVELPAGEFFERLGVQLVVVDRDVELLTVPTAPAAGVARG